MELPPHPPDPNNGPNTLATHLPWPWPQRRARRRLSSHRRGRARRPPATRLRLDGSRQGPGRADLRRPRELSPWRGHRRRPRRARAHTLKATIWLQIALRAPSHRRAATARARGNDRRSLCEGQPTDRAHRRPSTSWLWAWKRVSSGVVPTRPGTTMPAQSRTPLAAIARGSSCHRARDFPNKASARNKRDMAQAGRGARTWPACSTPALLTPPRQPLHDAARERSCTASGVRGQRTRWQPLS